MNEFLKEQGWEKYDIKKHYNLKHKVKKEQDEEESEEENWDSDDASKLVVTHNWLMKKSRASQKDLWMNFSKSLMHLPFLKKVFEDWKIAYDCLTDPESSSDEEKKLTRYINTLANPRYGMDGFIGGIFRFIFILFQINSFRFV